MAEAMLWNVARTESVRASKIRNFGIYPEQVTTTRKASKLLGWYNENEHFYFGFFETEDEARIYLRGLHEQIEGRKE